MRVHHIALRTHDVHALSAFYTRWLGLREVRDVRPLSVWLGLAEDAVLMIEARADAEPPIPVGSMELIAFASDARARADLRARLVAAEMLEAETEHTLYFRDPEGRRIGVSTYPLASAR